MYGDLSLEDVDEFEGLEPEDGREIKPEGRFQRDEVRSFERDFEYDLDRDLADEGQGYYENGIWMDDYLEKEDEEPEDSEMGQDLQDLSEDKL